MGRDPGSELRLGGREKRRAKTKNGIYIKKVPALLIYISTFFRTNCNIQKLVQCLVKYELIWVVPRAKR